MRAVPLAVVSILAMAMLAACNPQEQAKKEPPPAPPPPAVTVAKPTARTVIDRDEYVGRFLATESVEMRARVSGYLATIGFTDGQLVEKGQLLFTVDKRPYEAALDQAKADINRVQARLDSTTSDLARSERLVKDNNISAQVFEQRVAAKREAEAQLESAEAALRRAKLDLEFTDLRSPLAGRIGDRRVAAGNLVTGGTQGNTTLLATVVSLDPIYFEFNMDETAYLRLARLEEKTGRARGGLPVELKLVDEKDFSHKGAINFVDNVIDQSSGTIRMRASMPNPKDLFTPGMFGRVRVNASEPYQALLVPEAAVVSDQSRKIVLVVGPENVVQPRPVVLGALIDGMRVVVSGLGPEDSVIVNGLMKARPGAKVTPQPAAPPGGAPAPAAAAPGAGAPKS